MLESLVVRQVNIPNVTEKWATPTFLLINRTSTRLEKGR